MSCASVPSAPVAQLAELRPFKSDVVRSSRTGGTTNGRANYMAVYMLRRYHARRAQAITTLGGHCVECGITEGLEIDHVDPATKSFALSQLWSVSEKRFRAELAKCQLLCRPHHRAKTSREQSVAHGGGLSGKKNCPCALCRARKSEYNRTRKALKAAS